MEKINEITRDNYPDLFSRIIKSHFTVNTNEHRRDSSFYRTSIYLIDKESFPDNPEIWGYWETNIYTWDDNYGVDKSDIDSLEKVDLVEKTIITQEWQKVK